MDYDRGKESAQRLWKYGLAELQIDDPLTESFSQGALDELDSLQKGTPGVLREVLEGAQVSAEQLNVESFHGVLEVVQNADDLGALEVRVAVQRNRNRSTLLIAHDGDRIHLEHVISMTLAFVSTKRDDPRAKGRFGIGLKTLGCLGRCLKVHCSPYDFIIEDNSVHRTNASEIIDGFYDPASTNTLLELELHSGFDVKEFYSWFFKLGPETLLFLDSVQTLRLYDIRLKKDRSHHSLKGPATKVASLPLLTEPCRCTVMKDSKSDRSWTRYEIDKKVPPKLKRRHKAIGETTPIGVVVPSQSDELGQFYAGLPLRIQNNFQISLNAQFDVDTARREIQHNSLNIWLIEQLGTVVTAIALDGLRKGRSKAWKVIPLREERVTIDDVWLSDRISGFVNSIQKRTKRHCTVRVDSRQRRLREIAYEAESLKMVISQKELTGLRPGLFLLPKGTRDKEGRWRTVLDELGEATLVGVKEALELFDWDDEDLKERDARWFIKLARAALDKGLSEHILNQRSVVTADNRRIVPPMPHHEGQLLLRLEHPEALVFRLGLAHTIHPAYLSRGSDAVVVRNWLEKNSMLHGAPDALSTLKALAAQGENGKLFPIDDVGLRTLRDAFEEVSTEIAEDLGPKVGRVITLSLQQWKGKKRVYTTSSPCEAYLPASIEDRKEGWNKAAATTPGIKWIHPRYSKVLRRKGRPPGKEKEQRIIGARSLFRLLGAEDAPRLVEPDRYETRYDDPASRIDFERLSPSQREARARLERHTTHLKDDRLSPDLAAVLKNIQRDRKRGQRRQRVRALLTTLEREWARLYSGHLTAHAVRSDYSWVSAGTIPASWIGTAMDEPWLLNESGKLKAPKQLVIRTPVTEAIFGDQPEFYARELDKTDCAMPFIRAVGVKTDPEVSDIVEQLRELRQSNQVPDKRSLELRYAAIAANCKERDPKPDDQVGDLTVRQLRSRFGIHQKKPGLVFDRGQWLPPSHIFLGAPIFGNRRPFVSKNSSATQLWRTLGITSPTLGDCVAVLDEIAAQGGVSPEEQTLANIYLYIEEKLRNATKRDQRHFANLPLWTGTAWQKSRPIYVARSTLITAALSDHISVWQLPVAPSTIPRLIEASGVSVLSTADFVAVVHKNAFVTGKTFERQFKTAVELLQDWLARHDRGLAEIHALPWDELASPRIACDANLKLEIKVDRRSPISVPSRSHISFDPLTFYFSDADAFGEEDAGGQAVASLFSSGDRDKLALAWCSCWVRAGKGERGVIALAEDSRSKKSLEKLFEQASDTYQPKTLSRSKSRATKTQTNVTATEEPPVRRLKTLDQIYEKTVDTVTEDNASKSKKRRRRGLRDKLPKGKPIDNGSKPAPRSAPLDYSEQEKEEFALHLLHRAINGEATELRDYRHLRGIGADALDRLSRYFEIKSYYGAMPDEVTLTANEARRALIEGDKYFLAVVSGLEEGYETTVKIFPNPLRNLDIKPNTSVILSGVTRRGTAIEVCFQDTEVEEQMT